MIILLFSLKSKKKKENNSIANKIIKNASWLMSEKIITMIIGVFVIALVARYFGPEQFGTYNYALAYISLFTALSTLGMESIFIKSIIDKKYDEGTIIFTTFIMRLVSGIIIILLATGIMKFISPDDNSIHLLIMILSLSMIFKSLEVIQFWLYSHQKGKILAITKVYIFIFVSILKILLVVFNGNIYQYAAVYVVDSFIIGTSLIIVYFKYRENNKPFKLNLVFAKEILTKSWYLILSGIMVSLYMRVDQIMIGNLLQNYKEVGIYSAAVRIAEMWYFVPMAIIISFKPIIMNYKKTDSKLYEKTIIKLYSSIIWISIIASITIYFFSEIFISVLYGIEFIEAASILTISVWAGLFAMLGTARDTWLVAENLQKYTVLYISMGLMTNILLNLFLIPIYGGTGAAIATLCSQFMVAIIGPLFFKKMRVSSFMMLKSINPKIIVREVLNGIKGDSKG